MSNLISMVTYGNLSFTKLAVSAIRQTVTEPYDMFIVVGKPDDTETVGYLERENIPFVFHDFNYGFPYSVNDIYDYAWKENNYKNLIILGNDVIAYPYAVDSLIKVANETDNSWVCARQYDVKSLVRDHPEASEYFDVTSNYRFKDFSTRPWEIGMDVTDKISLVGNGGLSDVHNLALFKKDVFDAIGYIDVNFYPAYYEDNDYVRRAILKDIKSCTVENAIYFHFWSRTIHQGAGGASHHGYFAENRGYYMRKWGGDFGHELFDKPFNGVPYFLGGVLPIPSTVEIFDRSKDVDYINYWRFRQGDSQKTE